MNSHDYFVSILKISHYDNTGTHTKSPLLQFIPPFSEKSSYTMAVICVKCYIDLPKVRLRKHKFLAVTLSTTLSWF